MKIKFFILTLFLLSLFIQTINLIEVSRILKSSQFDMLSIAYLSLLKLPSTINQIVPFGVIVSTAFFYRYLVSNNELVSISISKSGVNPILGYEDYTVSGISGATITSSGLETPAFLNAVVLSTNPVLQVSLHKLNLRSCSSGLVDVRRTALT